MRVVTRRGGRRDPSWLWRGNVPADVAPAAPEGRALVVGRHEADHVRGFLWRGVLADVVLVAPEGRSLVAGRQEQGDARSFLWRGVLVDALVAPEGRSLVVARQDAQRSDGFLWRGNVPVGVSADLEIRRSVVVGRAEFAAQQAFLRSGNQPLDVLPEVYRRAIVGREELYDRRPIQPFLHRGNVPGDVLPPQETIRRWLLTFREAPARDSIQTFLWPGNVPIPQTPEVYRRIVVGPSPEMLLWVQPSVLKPGNQPEDYVPPPPSPFLPAMQLFVLP